jgi:hypothetical protein
VNALSFSSGDARFIASGGDGEDLRFFSFVVEELFIGTRMQQDFYIHLWDMHQEDIIVPSRTLTGPKVDYHCFYCKPSESHLGTIQSNIFTIAFSATNRYLLS